MKMDKNCLHTFNFILLQCLHASNFLFNYIFQYSQIFLTKLNMPNAPPPPPQHKYQHFLFYFPFISSFSRPPLPYIISFFSLKLSQNQQALSPQPPLNPRSVTSAFIFCFLFLDPTPIHIPFCIFPLFLNLKKPLFSQLKKFFQ